jgi:primosomal protein N' (replication factor Y)
MEVQVAVPTPLSQTFTYKSDVPIDPGTRVMVSFGPRKVVGVVVGTSPDKALGERTFEIKPVAQIIDKTPVYSEVLLKLADWLAVYYMHPIGEVLRAMLPASTKKSVSQSYEVTESGLLAMDDPSHGFYDLLNALCKKQKPLSSATIKKKIVLLDPGKDATAVLAALVKGRLFQSQKGKKIAPRSVKEALPDQRSEMDINYDAPELTAEQKQVLSVLIDQGIEAEPGSAPKPFLLQGVTGSGKTEVYLNLIAANESERRRNGGEGRGISQTLLLVPEISLTPQMTEVFTRRFPGEIAVVHSAMSDTDRWNQLQKLRSGEASILIGPRSAVFAPFKNLSLIIVDEEHDPSYKQGTGLAYNGRDVAIVRAKMEGCTILLGSATPSLESYWNATSGKYHHLKLTQRVGARPMPTVETITTTAASKKGLMIGGAKQGVETTGQDLPIAPEIIAALQANLIKGNQAIVLVNRRGYAYYLFDVREKQPYLCKNCSISMTLHSRSTVLQCHYCDHQTSLSAVQRERPEAKFVAVGYGSQKAEDCLNELLPGARIARLDSDVVAERDVLPKTLAKFRKGELDILVGTQILAKGHDFPKVTLIAILEIDQLLNLPDLRAGERTFQLIVQAAGRAGRAQLPGHVLVQSSRLDHPVVQAGLAQDFELFAQRELDFRKAHLYPPFGKLVLVELNSEDLRDLTQYCDKISQWIDQMHRTSPEFARAVRVLGPAIPAIETIRKRHRRTILFSSPDIGKLRRVVSIFWAQFSKVPRGVRIKIDVDPQALV